MAPSRSPTGFHPHFSPWLADQEQLSRTLVGHHDILRDFLGSLQHVENGSPASHVLLVGPRGIGKTHVLCLAGHYASGRLPLPADWTGPAQPWVCVLFTEEEYAGQNSLANFLLAALTKLHEMLPSEPSWDLPAHIHGETDQSVIDCCFERLERFHAERGRKVLLLIDNLQKILQQWPEEDHQRFRSFLSRNNLLVIFGSAPSVFREVMGQKAAFHEFFEIRVLTELDNQQVLELLSRRFEEDGRQREFETRRDDLSKKIPAMEVLTGGNPRLVLFLYQIVTRSAFLDIEIALRSLLEDLREYFVGRFDGLPDQARKVLDTIAQMSGPATPTEISQAARLPVATVNAQLQRLKKGHYVRPIKLQRQKSTRYDITERLFRIWRQTATVAGRQRFRFLADFLKLYFTPEEVHALYSHHLEYLHGSTETSREEILRHVEELYYFQAAGQGDIRYGAFSNRMESLLRLGELRWAEEEAQSFAAESVRNQDKPGIIAAFRSQAAIHLQSGRYAEAVGDIEELIDADAGQDALSAAEGLVDADPQSSNAWSCLGASAFNLGSHERALEAFRKAAKLGKPTAFLWTCQSLALGALGRHREALACLGQAVSLDANDAVAWEWLGVSAGTLGDYERALEAFRTAARVGQPTPDLWGDQAITLRALGREQGALECFERVVSLDTNNAQAWEDLGLSAGVLGHYERALEAFRTAAKVGQPTATLWSHQAIALGAMGREQEALNCAERAVSLDASDARAWEWLGISAHSVGNHERALEAFRTAAKVGEASGDILERQAAALRLLGRPKEGLGVLEEALALEATNADLWRSKVWTLSELNRFEDALQCLDRARQLGAAPRSYHQDRGDLLLLAGRFREALAELEAGLAVEPDDLDLQADRQIALGCFRQLGPEMEALPPALAQLNIPQADVSSVCDLIHDVALNALRRGETRIARGLFAATLEMGDWSASEWFGKQVGRFLRRALDIQPQAFTALANLVAERVKDESVLKLLDPFLKANDLLRTKDVTILERLFVEVRELVLDIVRRVDPELHQQVQRLT